MFRRKQKTIPADLTTRQRELIRKAESIIAKTREISSEKGIGDMVSSMMLRDDCQLVEQMIKKLYLQPDDENSQKLENAIIRLQTSSENILHRSFSEYDGTENGDSELLSKKTDEPERTIAKDPDFLYSVVKSILQLCSTCPDLYANGPFDVICEDTAETPFVYVRGSLLIVLNPSAAEKRFVAGKDSSIDLRSFTGPIFQMGEATIEEQTLLISPRSFVVFRNN